MTYMFYVLSNTNLGLKKILLSITFINIKDKSIRYIKFYFPHNNDSILDKT